MTHTHLKGGCLKLGDPHNGATAFLGFFMTKAIPKRDPPKKNQESHTLPMVWTWKIIQLLCGLGVMYQFDPSFNHRENDFYVLFPGPCMFGALWPIATGLWRDKVTPCWSHAVVCDAFLFATCKGNQVRAARFLVLAGGSGPGGSVADLEHINLSRQPCGWLLPKCQVFQWISQEGARDNFVARKGKSDLPLQQTKIPGSRHKCKAKKTKQSLRPSIPSS